MLLLTLDGGGCAASSRLTCSSRSSVPSDGASRRCSTSLRAPRPAGSGARSHRFHAFAVRARRAVRGARSADLPAHAARPRPAALRLEVPTRASSTRLLRLELGEARLSAARPRTMVPAFSLARRDLVWFDSDCRRPFPRVKVADCDPPAWQVAAATSAAPTYFEPARVDGVDGEWLDGGVGANDPTPFAIALALDERPEEVFVLSIGTGGFFPLYPRRLRGSSGSGSARCRTCFSTRPASSRTTPRHARPRTAGGPASSAWRPTRRASPTTSTTPRRGVGGVAAEAERVVATPAAQRAFDAVRARLPSGRSIDEPARS